MTRHEGEIVPPLHVEPDSFFAAGELLIESLPVFAQSTPALKRLGPLPFTGSTFPLMGFFASVYEHISTQAGVMLVPSSQDK